MRQLVIPAILGGLFATACGTAAPIIASGPASTQPAAPAPSPSSAPSPPGATAQAVVPPPAASAAPVHTPVTTAPPAPMVVAIAPVSPSSFAIRPLVGGGPDGSVTTSMSGMGSHLHIVITGLTPGSTHAVHDHLGNCSSASTTVHVAVLAVATADPRGTIVIDAAVPASESGSGRIVIVYLSSRPNLIVGCADL